MIKCTLQPKDSTMYYQGVQYKFTNFSRNEFTNVWTFDITYKGGSLLGVPISAGTNVIKGNGLPIFAFVFLDNQSPVGEISVPADTSFYILEEGE